jgi:hypothetical protein
MKSILTFLALLALALGGMVALSHHDVIQRSDLAYKKYLPVSASFSRFRGDSHHLLSIYYRLHFAGKKPPVREAVAYWSVRPFRHVTLMAK